MGAMDCSFFVSKEMSHPSAINNNSAVRRPQLVNDDSDMSTVAGRSEAEFRTPREKPHDGEELLGGQIEYDPANGGACSCGKNCCLCCDCCFTWRSLVLLGGFALLIALPGVVISPILPKMKKEYFGSDAKAAMFQSISDGCIALINTILCGAYAQLLDTIGRKPFFIAAGVFAIVQMILILVFESIAPVWIIAGSLTRLVQGSYLLSWIADNYTPEQRPRAFAITQAIGIGCAIPAIAVTIAEPPKAILFGVGIALQVLSIIYAVFLIPESLPKKLRKPLSEFTIKTFTNPFGTLRYLCVSRCIAAMVSIVALAATAQIGTQEVTVFWVDERVGWGPIDIASNLLEMGIIVPIGLLVGMPIVLRYLSPIMVLFMALVGLSASIILIATIWAKWVMFAVITPLMIVEVWAVPIIYSMMANAGNPQDQAKRMTAMQVVIDLCGAIGPLLFGIAIGTLHGPWVIAPFMFCLLLCIISGFLTWKLAKWYEIDMKDGRDTGIKDHDETSGLLDSQPRAADDTEGERPFLDREDTSASV